jgi:hypothetical protein
MTLGDELRHFEEVFVISPKIGWPLFDVDRIDSRVLGSSDDMEGGG